MKKFKLWPRSLRLQMILMMLGTIILVQVGSLSVGNHLRERYMEDVVVNYLTTTIRTLRAAVAQIPAENRASFIEEASQKKWRLWSRQLPKDTRFSQPLRRGAENAPRHEKMAEYPTGDLRNNLRNIINHLNRALNDGTRVGLSRGEEPRMYISLLPQLNEFDNTVIREWLVIPLDRIEPPNMQAIMMAWLSINLLLIAMAAGFAWHITRPLTRLSRAADQLAQGRPERVTPAGPTETRSLGERFNAMLDALEESKLVQQTLLAGLPHDLKSPLARMWLRLEMTDDQALKEGMRNDVQDMQRMIDQFIGYVRGSDPGTYTFTKLELNAWIDERVSSWEGAGSPVFLKFMPTHKIYIHADGLALGRLLDNLISNALKHGQPPVEVHVHADRKKVVISVCDHGEGIPLERRTEALRAFSRLDSARTKTGSVGLGLALADTIAKAHHGSLELGSGESGGLRVDITLPLAES
ncbi:ATP-binding protein [Advenella alkanexedens]|uniref:ATP-binding protein n=1 Tax=Advenella alkanexedens TaxID=1481665 RepID=UPI002676486F|nr:ATP-binding protein [Advenella alkanexedens]WKU19105.1 ATP-binding protein [Advenella alkanexedens]